MADVVTVNLRFAVDTALGTFQDTLVFTEAEWEKRDDVAIEAAKQEHADAWVTFRSAQIADEDTLRTAQGKRDKIAEFDVRIADIAAVKARLQSELQAS